MLSHQAPPQSAPLIAKSQRAPQFGSTFAFICKRNQGNCVRTHIFRVSMSVSLAQNLNLDVLSMIFTDLEVNYHLYMLKVSFVCRHWYNVALSTPRAWSRISMDFSTSTEYLKMYLARSGNASLHIFVNERLTDTCWGLLAQQTGRIRCLTIRACYRILQFSSFPALEKLRLYPHYDGRKHDILTPHATSLLDMSRFPRLQCVEMSNIPNALCSAIIPSGGFPRLQRLSTDLGNEPFWLPVILNTADTLISLTLNIREKYIHLMGFGDVHLLLPHLRHFGISGCHNANEAVIEITAPRVESVQYLKRHEVSTRLTGDILKVKYLLTNSISVLSQYSNIRTLWLLDPPTDVWLRGAGTSQRGLAWELADKIALCPRLEHIWIMDPFGDGNKGLNGLDSAVEGTKISIGVSRRSIPGSMVSAVIWSR
jgi:F-box-like